MKIFLNSPVIGNNFNTVNKRGENTQVLINTVPKHDCCVFSARPDSHFLLSQSNNLLCAYSRKSMISPYDIRSIYAKLVKKPNAQSAVNCLQQYENFMQDVELTIFDMFRNYANKGKKTFKDILGEMYPAALSNLEEKQYEILNGKNDIILDLSESAYHYVSEIRDNAIAGIKDGTFRRQDLLEQIKNIETCKENTTILNEIYKSWYTLPRSSKDCDAFIVKYSRYPHESIAQRLVSTSVATIEHIKPQSRGGEDRLENYLLVSQLFNNDRDTMSLAEYIELNPDIDIKHNIQRYVDDICEGIKTGRSAFINKDWYLSAIQKRIFEETNGLFQPDISIIMPNRNGSGLTASRKGANRYRLNHSK